MRRSIALLITAGLLPIVVLGAVFGSIMLHNQRQQTEARARAHAQLAATLIADRLEAVVSLTQLIARSPVFDHQLDRERFTDYADRAMALHPDWRAISLATPDGQHVLETPLLIGGLPQGPVLDQDSLRQAVRKRQGVIGETIVDAGGVLTFAVRAPVIRDSAVRYVVSAIVPAAILRKALDFSTLPPGCRAGVVDGKGLVMALSDPSAQGLGQYATAETLRARASGHQGLYTFTRRDGTPAMGLFVPVAGTNWTVHVSTPIHAYTASTDETFLLLIVATALSLILFAMIAHLLLADIRLSREREAAALQRQRMEALGILTGGVAHDFNNLLTPIIGGLDLLRSWAEGQPQALRYIGLATTAAERARTLVGRLLSYSRAQTLVPTHIDLNAMFDNLLDLIRSSVAPSVTVMLKIAPSLPTVCADKAQLELAILNLAVNARDAMPKGGTVTISVALAHLSTVTDLPAGQYIAIALGDTGAGMDEATLQRAVEPFFTTKKAEKGTGLGLSMVHGFAAQSGGALKLQSRIGTGTTAVIVLPAGDELPSPSAKPPSLPPKDGRSTILLVDDELGVREATSDLLRSNGHEVVSAESVAEALRALDRNPRIDAIITDYLMPGQTGADLIERVRVDYPHLPILLITGFMDAAARLSPDVKILPKPFHAEELFGALSEMGVT